MSELIDRQALKDAVKRYAGEPIKEKDRKCQAICLDMLGIIDAQPTASPWHRVEEELPKDNTWCVFISENKHNFEQYRWIGTYSEEWGFQDDDRFMVDNVLYWMPIEPPKEDA